MVYRGLARALNSEDLRSVAKAWGVPLATVQAWKVAVENPRAELRPKLNGKRIWTPDEDRAVLTKSDDNKLAKKLGRTLVAVSMSRGGVGTQLGLGTVSGFDLRSLALAIAGSVVLLLILGALSKRGMVKFP